MNHETIYENRIPYEKVNDLMNLLESVDCEYDFETATVVILILLIMILLNSLRFVISVMKN